MESQVETQGYGKVYEASPPVQGTPFLILCEHASNRVPACLNDLGLSRDVLQSHVAWDPGALGVARALRKRLGAVLINSNVSRLVYDCNRPPEVDSAVPERSEVYDIPGNVNLRRSARAERIKNVYDPFVKAVTDEVRKTENDLELLVTIHSFTPVYHGKTRAVELGILHGRDDRFSKAMMALKPEELPLDTRLNEPYAARDGVTHSIDLHGTDNGLLNVMIEIRNDLIKTSAEQDDMAALLSPWITKTLDHLRQSGVWA
ncbi:N-formylglutamate amidohydrolase [Alisedimentitalea sp. MJ-SS2]|uniref:N-formylglutamate amidohydrolase n=1 Tax=Aliisedimentitalea sp. MJ-SS2 TaxID=3049795 RepID=UPI00290F4386|nr:N-formylglutamate amidohydrolase [Alisedimentitalea sp. MJ-SS2]MDU8929943.1 N-formylglutamate amidohydrolase [Alisedimentitalea sp. MJ-SS2]